MNTHNNFKNFSLWWLNDQQFFLFYLFFKMSFYFCISYWFSLLVRILFLNIYRFLVISTVLVIIIFMFLCFLFNKFSFFEKWDWATNFFSSFLKCTSIFAFRKTIFYILYLYTKLITCSKSQKWLFQFSETTFRKRQNLICRQFESPRRPVYRNLLSSLGGFPDSQQCYFKNSGGDGRGKKRNENKRITCCLSTAVETRFARSAEPLRPCFKRRKSFDFFLFLGTALKAFGKKRKKKKGNTRVNLSLVHCQSLPLICEKSLAKADCLKQSPGIVFGLIASFLSLRDVGVLFLPRLHPRSNILQQVQRSIMSMMQQIIK